MDDVGSARAWVVKCTGCTCLIVCRAVDQQAEHGSPESAEPHPGRAVILTCCCCWKTFRYLPNDIFKGHPSPSNSCPARRQKAPAPDGKKNGALLIAASLIAAVRLNRHEIKPLPALTYQSCREYPIGRDNSAAIEGINIDCRNARRLRMISSKGFRQSGISYSR
jgi:hypothetical protein